MKETIGLFVLLLVGCVKPQQGPYDLPPPGWDGPPVMQCDLVRTKTIASHVDEGDLVVQNVGPKSGKVLITAIVREGDHLDLVASSYRCSVGPKESVPKEF